MTSTILHRLAHLSGGPTYAACRPDGCPAVRLARALLGEPVRRAAAGESRDVRGPPARVQWTPRGSPGAHAGKVS